jgi:hypothetical protein
VDLLYGHAKYLGLSITRPSSFATQYEISWSWTFASSDPASAPVKRIDSTSSVLRSVALPVGYDDDRYTA